MKTRIPLLTLTFLLLVSTTRAQGVEPVGKTLPMGVPALLEEVRTARKTRTRRPVRKLPPVKFAPVADSGVALTLASALATEPQQKAALLLAFRQIKQAYETEVRREGKANNLAAAFAFFVAANVMAYQQTDPPPDEVVEVLFQELQSTIAGRPEFARMTNLEKQKLHDWLVYMGGFSMTGYMSARQASNQADLRTHRELSGYLLRLVLGVDPGTLSFANNELTFGP